MLGGICSGISLPSCSNFALYKQGNGVQVKPDTENTYEKCATPSGFLGDVVPI